MPPTRMIQKFPVVSLGFAKYELQRATIVWSQFKTRSRCKMETTRFTPTVWVLPPPLIIPPVAPTTAAIARLHRCLWLAVPPLAAAATTAFLDVPAAAVLPVY